MKKRIVIEIDEDTRRAFKAAVYSEGMLMRDKLIEMIKSYLKTRAK